MKINDVYTAYVSWPGGGKRRPVLVLGYDNRVVRVFKITSKFDKKSDAIKKYYYPINQWREAGLKKKSYIDTIRKENLSLEKVKFVKIGSLQIVDKNGLAAFIENLNM